MRMSEPLWLAWSAAALHQCVCEKGLLRAATATSDCDKGSLDSAPSAYQCVCEKGSLDRGRMIYDAESARYRSFLRPWFRELVADCQKEAKDLAACGKNVLQKGRYLILASRLGMLGRGTRWPLTPWIALQKLRYLVGANVWLRRVRWNKLGGALRPPRPAPDGYRRRMGTGPTALPHGSRLSQLYFDHLRADVENLVVRDPRVGDLIVRYLDTHGVEYFGWYKQYHVATYLKWWFLSWSRYAWHCSLHGGRSP